MGVKSHVIDCRYLFWRSRKAMHARLLYTFTIEVFSHLHAFLMILHPSGETRLIEGPSAGAGYKAWRRPPV